MARSFEPLKEFRIPVVGVRFVRESTFDGNLLRKCAQGTETLAPPRNHFLNDSSRFAGLFVCHKRTPFIESFPVFAQIYAKVGKNAFRPMASQDVDEVDGGFDHSSSNGLGGSTTPGAQADQHTLRLLFNPPEKVLKGVENDSIRPFKITECLYRFPNH
jgi:hypothetical protein